MSYASSLPPGLEHYRTTPEFSAATIPASLLTTHSTKSGVWGIIRVKRGALRYCIDTDPPRSLVVEEDGMALILPGVPHHVEILDAATTFAVEFHRRSATDNVEVSGRALEKDL